MYKKLPINLRFLASLPPKKVFEAAAILVTDPFKVYSLIEEVYRKDFLEKVFWKQFGFLVNENAEPQFSAAIERI